jgi:hypothetical protein
MTTRRNSALAWVWAVFVSLACLGAAGPASAQTPADIVLARPGASPLPADLELLSSQAHMTIPRVFGCYTGDLLDPGRQDCEPYFLRREGPDASGLYHYLWRLPTAAAGEVHLEVIAWTDDRLSPDRETISFTATSSGIVLGDLHTCLVPKVRAEGGRLGYFELAYYSRRSSTAVVLRQKRLHGSWGARELVARANFPVGGSSNDSFLPYLRRTIRLRVERSDLRKGRLRMTYYVLPGNDYGPLGRRRGRPFSTQECVPPGGI